ncbi:MAG: LytTR family DNA-binding domain-containing protein, partial [Bacteroidota bacterium]
IQNSFNAGVMISCVVVDDEALSREIIISFINSTESLELIQEFSNAMEARDFLANNSVDLLFLDINMPELSGVDFLKQTPHPPATIFITAYPNFAVDGFELNAIDYLVKPVAYERFEKAVRKYKNHDSTNDKLVVKADKRTYNVDQTTIYYLQSAGDYIKLFSKHHNLVINVTMKDIEPRMNKSFLRIHKSFIANLDHMEYLEGNQIKINGQMLPIGAKYRDKVLKKIKE